MSSIVRRAGSKLLRMLTSSADRAAEVDHVVGYAKAVVGVSQFFGRAPDGRISQVTPAVRLVTPGENLAATIAAYPGETIHLLPGNHVLAADVASTAETLHFRRGAVLQIGAARTLGSNLDFSEAGLVQPTGAFTFTPTGKINLSPNHFAFDPSLGGLFNISSRSINQLTPYNFGAVGDGVAYDDVACRAWIRSCEFSVGALAGSGGVRAYVPPGSFLVGLLHDVDSRGDYVCLLFSKSLLHIEGNAERVSRFVYKPDAAFAAGPQFFLMRWENPAGPLLSPGLYNISFAANQDNTRIKIAMDLHDVRDPRMANIDVANWTDASLMCIGLRIRGRDAFSLSGFKFNCDRPVFFWFNDDETAPLDANGIPTAYRDTSGKDFDHIDLIDFDAGVTDNIYKAACHVSAGVVGRNLTLSGDWAAVGGAILVCVDRLDAAGVAFAGAAVVPRRLSNHWAVTANGRVEGITGVPSPNPDIYACRIERHPNGPLREFYSESFHYGEGYDARRFLLTGAALNGSAWNGVRTLGVWKTRLDLSCRYNGIGKPIDIDPGTRTLLERPAGMDFTGSDHNVRFPESNDQWDFLGLEREYSWYMFKVDTPNDIPDVGGHYDLQATGVPIVTYRQLKDGYIGFWVYYTDIQNQKLRLNTVDAVVDPDTNKLAYAGYIWPDVAWAPAGGETFVNLSGTTLGPLVRVRADFKVEMRISGTDYVSQLTYWDDDQPFYFRLYHDPILSKLILWLVKEDGRREKIIGTWVAGVGNNVNKGFGPSGVPIHSPKHWIRFASIGITTAAEQDGFDVAHALGILPRTGTMETGGISGLELSYLTDATVQIAPGRCRASDDYADIVSPVPLTVNLAVAGAGGIDTGAEAADKTYFIWVLADSLGANAPVAVASLSAVQPALPVGYDLQRRVGAIRNDGGSNILKFWQRDNGNTRSIWYDEDLANLNVLTGGSAVAFTNVSLAVFVPSTSSHVHLLVGFVAPPVTGAATDALELRPDTATAADGPWQFIAGNTLAVERTDQVEMPCVAQIIEYKVTDADDDADIWVLGYEDPL